MEADLLRKADLQQWEKTTKTDAAVQQRFHGLHHIYNLHIKSGSETDHRSRSNLALFVQLSINFIYYDREGRR
jgi:hypothetical protein